MTQHRPSPPMSLPELVQAAHEGALGALADSRAGAFDAVAWTSAHLGAVHHVLTPAVAKARAVDKPTLRRLLDADHALHQELRYLERVLAGDATVPRGTEENARARVRAALVRHADAEREVLDAFADRAGPDAVSELAERYTDALGSGPTRPHPHLARSGRVLEGLAFLTASWRDHLLDVLDGRPVPVPRPPREPHAAGLWGQYALGGTLPPPEVRADRGR